MPLILPSLNVFDIIASASFQVTNFMITLEEFFNQWKAETPRALIFRSSFLKISSKLNFSRHLSLILLGMTAILRHFRREY